MTLVLARSLRAAVAQSIIFVVALQTDLIAATQLNLDAPLVEITGPVSSLLPGAPFQFSFSADRNETTIVQASTDLVNWTNLRTNLAGHTGFVDEQSRNFPRRFYRVLPANSGSSARPNSVFMPGEGFDTLQFSTSGKLGYIAWEDQNLIYRERNSDGRWSRQMVCGGGLTFVAGQREEYRFQPQAALLFDSLSAPHVLKLAGATIAHYVRGSNGQWSEAAPIAPQNAGSSFVLFAAALGAGNSLHVALVNSGSSPALTYGSNKSGSWQWSRISQITGNPRGFLSQSYSPRFFSLAVDSGNFAHLSFTPEFKMPTGPQGYLRPYSELFYASNRSGQWSIEKVMAPSDASGDAGAGASIAVGPDGKPAIASWYNERADTGSAQSSQLLFHRRDGNGNWTQVVIASSPDGYATSEGGRGTGFAPYLRFDSKGQPQIAFCDHASQHFSTGQNEYAGQIRLASFTGTGWNLKTLIQEKSPLNRQIVYPAMATLNSEVVVMALERETQWQAPGYRVANSTYRLVVVTDRLP
jgi:hypothetical protein